MSKKTILPLTTLLVSLLLTTTAWATQPPEPLQSDSAWAVTYWNNTTLSGTAALTTQDPSLDHDWSYGSPAAGVNADQFSARWTRYVDSEGYNGDLCWTKNNDTWRPSFNWARWYPTLAAGRYEVSVYVPERYTTTNQARYWIAHAEGYTGALHFRKCDAPV